MGVTLFCLFACWSQADSVPEHQVKAAFLLNFTKFVEWPAATFSADRAPINLCLLGDDPIEESLGQMVKGEEVNGRGLALRRIHRAAEAKGCQVLYVSPTERDIGGTLAGMGSGVLTVGEGDRFLRDGGMIAFVIDNRRVRFDVNLKAAVNASISISARLLGVARSVEK